MHGALRCLSMIASDIDEAQMPQVVPVLFPELKSIIASPEVRGRTTPPPRHPLAARGVRVAPSAPPPSQCRIRPAAGLHLA